MSRPIGALSPLVTETCLPVIGDPMPEPRPDASDQGHRGQVDAAVARLNATLAAAHGAGLTVVVSISPDTPGVWFADYRVSAQVYRRVLAPKPTEEVSS